MENQTSPSLLAAANSNRSEADVRARRRLIEDSYRAEGFSDSYIASHVTDDLAARMLAYDRKVLGAVAGLFVGGQR